MYALKCSSHKRTLLAKNIPRFKAVKQAIFAVWINTRLNVWW